MSRRPSRRRSLLVVSVLLLANAVVINGGQAEAATAKSRSRVIVELDEPPALAIAGRTPASAQRQRNDRSQQTVLHAISDAGVDSTVMHRYREAFSGLALEVDAEDVAELADIPGVRAVYPDEPVAASLDVSVPLIGAPDVWSRNDDSGAAVRGTGVTVAVIDSGIDYTHPALGEGFGDGFKVVGGYDFVNDDADPMDDYGHGTHVAGIVAGDGEVTGVAPGAQLLAYKALDRFGNGQASDIIAAIEAAVDPRNPHRADVVNMSLSGLGDGTDPLGRSAAAAVQAGVVVVASAGNAGPAGTVQSPASAAGVLAVGASTSGVRVPRVRALSPDSYDLQAVRQSYSANPPQEPAELPVVDGGSGTDAELARLDVAGKAVLVQPFNTPLDIAVTLEHLGARAVLFYFSDYVGATGAGVRSPAGTPAINTAGGKGLADAFAVGADEGRLDSLVAVQIPGANAARLQRDLGGTGVAVRLDGVDATDEMADFSSRGPGGLFGAQPQLVAPGVEVRSTYLNGTLVRASGTSMAAPHAAGAAALLRQLRPGWTANEVVGALTGTAHRLPDVGPLVQGQGRLDVAAAARAQVVATPPAVSLGLADLGGDDLAATQSFTLVNRGTEAADLRIGARPSGTDKSTVSVTPTTASLPPGGQATVMVSVSAPAPDSDTDVAGWVEVDVADPATPDIGIPYELAVRHLTVHVTPDPAVPGGRVTAMISSPALLAGAPSVTADCPKAEPVTVTATTTGTRSWRAQLPVGEAGLCQVRAAASADGRYGAGIGLTGTGTVEVAAAAKQSPAASRWRPVGPNGEGGYLKFNPTDRDGVYAPTPGGFGLFVSRDAMQTWRELRTMPVASGTVEDLVVDPHDGDRLYLAMSGGSADPSYSGRLFISADGGETWSTANLPDAPASTVEIDPTGHALAVAMGRNVFRSVDGGVTWTQLPSAWTDVRDVLWVGDDLYVATTTGLWVIRGALSSPQTPQKVFTPSILQFVDAVVGDARLIVAATWFDGLVASSDGGKTWRVLFAPQGFSKRFLGVSMVGDTIQGVASTGGVWVSRDRGTTWRQFADPVGPAIDFDVATWPQPRPSKVGKTYVSSSGAGIYETSNGTDYTRVGLPGARVYDLATGLDTNGQQVIVAGTYRNTYRSVIPTKESVDSGVLEWGPSGGEGLLGVAAQFVATSPADPQVMWKVLQGINDIFGIYRSGDAGATWDKVGEAQEVPYALLVHPADPDSVYIAYASLTGAGVVVSEDGGRSWAKRDAQRVFQALAGDPTDPKRLLAGSLDGVFESTDAGQTWRQLSSHPVTALEFDPADPAHVVAAGTALYNSHDGGRTFTSAPYGPLEIYARDIAFHRRDKDVVFVATSDFYLNGVRKGGRGVLISSDGGRSWSSFADGLANKDATSLAASPDGRHLFVGTMGGSAYRIRLPD
ncbi:S8 family serine peptidase [Micromonospora sp. NPDC005113]